MAQRVAVTLARSFCDTDPSVVTELRRRGYDVLVASESDEPLDAERVAAVARECDVLLVGTDVVSEAAMIDNPRLRGIVKHGAGTDNIDVAAARRRAIPVAYAPGVNADSVAELVIGLMVALARQIVAAAAEVRRGSWRHHIGMELAGKRLGLVGFGNIGREVARRALAFKMDVDYYDVFAPPASETTAACRRRERIEDLLGAADVVSLHLPLTPDTRGLLGAERLHHLRPGAFLVNTSRGGIADESAVADMLRNGRLAGAAFDVFAVEPPGSPLLGLDHVIATPHIGGSTHEAAERLIDVTVRSVESLLRGEQPPHPVPAA